MRTPQAAADEWASRMAQSQQKITEGIDAVTESPTAKAAQNLDKYLANTQEAVSSGRMAARLNAVTLQQWKEAAKSKVGRIGTGAATAKPKMLAHLAKFLPFVQQVRQQIRQMPSTTRQDRIQRMIRNAEMLAEFRR